MRVVLLRSVAAGRSSVGTTLHTTCHRRVVNLLSRSTGSVLEESSLSALAGTQRSLWTGTLLRTGGSSAWQATSTTQQHHRFHLPHQSHHQQQQRRGFAAAFVPAGANGEDEESRREVAADLFAQYCQTRAGEGACLDFTDVRSLLRGVGVEKVHDEALQKIFDVADTNRNGLISLEQFLDNSDFILGGNPARIILCVGGPGSGKGQLSKRLQDECQVVHLSSGDLLREEVARGSALGNKVKDIMARGELVSSAIMVALMKRRMRDHPGKRVLLDGFPRSAENARDLVTLCGKPELALHLVCDDTVLLERIIGRGEGAESDRRDDDNFETALERLKTFHKHHPQTLEWLREQHVPVINLDCSGSADSVWQQLQAIGRLMRPAVKLPKTQKQYEQQQQQKEAATGTLSNVVPGNPPPLPRAVPDAPVFAPLFGGTEWENRNDAARTGS
mmetsp:Transcript_2119/g.5243  ORF Transcript_2119/g.5243 Transcript_2119/m.5243 type:complete len:447 (+) Transcript_2119:166-1506(+)